MLRGHNILFTLQNYAKLGKDITKHQPGDISIVADYKTYKYNYSLAPLTHESNYFLGLFQAKIQQYTLDWASTESPESTKIKRYKLIDFKIYILFHVTKNYAIQDIRYKKVFKFIHRLPANIFFLIFYKLTL